MHRTTPSIPPSSLRPTTLLRPPPARAPHTTPRTAGIPPSDVPPFLLQVRPRACPLCFLYKTTGHHEVVTCYPLPSTHHTTQTSHPPIRPLAHNNTQQCSIPTDYTSYHDNFAAHHFLDTSTSAHSPHRPALDLGLSAAFYERSTRCTASSSPSLRFIA